jgi:folate-binding protein YgfZ
LLDPILVLVSQIATVESDYRTLTERCGMLDRSERGKLGLTGRDAKSFLQGQITNDVERLKDGEGCYAAFLTPKGKMLGDVRVLATEDELLLDTERVALQALFNMIRRFSIGYDVQLHKHTLECGLLSLIGPHADRVAGAEGLPAAEHVHRPLPLDGYEARAIRTDAGLDFLCAASDTDGLTAALVERGAVPACVEAVECLRVEQGRPRYGVDLDETVIPQEAGLNARAVSFTKGCYVGQETVARLHYRGKPNRHLRGIRLSDQVPAGRELLLGDRVVGRLTTVVDSPRLGPIGLALVRREAAPGTVLSVASDGGTGLVVELPFAHPPAA